MFLKITISTTNNLKTFYKLINRFLSEIFFFGDSELTNRLNEVKNRINTKTSEYLKKHNRYSYTISCVKIFKTCFKIKQNIEKNQTINYLIYQLTLNVLNFNKTYLVWIRSRIHNTITPTSSRITHVSKSPHISSLSTRCINVTRPDFLLSLIHLRRTNSPSGFRFGCTTF